MKRREILKYTAMMTGAALSAPLILSLQGCKGDATSIATDPLSFFTEDKLRVVTAIADTILPKTDSPSASEVGVPRMIDQMVGKVYNEEARGAYKQNVNKLLGYLMKQSKGKGFHTLSGDEKKTMLNKLMKSSSDAFESERKGLLDIKQQTIAYYLNTEEVATKFMNYLPAPGPYQPCIDLASVGGKAWAI